MNHEKFHRRGVLLKTTLKYRIKASIKRRLAKVSKERRKNV